MFIYHDKYFHSGFIFCKTLTGRYFIASEAERSEASSQSEDSLRKARELSVGIGEKTSEYLENEAFLTCGV